MPTWFLDYGVNANPTAQGTVRLVGSLVSTGVSRARVAPARGRRLSP
jgi:hypothetical protein